MHVFWNKVKCAMQELGRSVFVLIPLAAGIVVILLLGIVGKGRRQKKAAPDQ